MCVECEELTKALGLEHCTSCGFAEEKQLMTIYKSYRLCPGCFNEGSPILHCELCDKGLPEAKTKILYGEPYCESCLGYWKGI